MDVQAMVLPFFNDIVGFLGALAFWPLTVSLSNGSLTSVTLQISTDE